jgi:signal transduction histidine kinase
MKSTSLSSRAEPDPPSGALLVGRLKAEWWAVGLALSLLTGALCWFDGLAAIDDLVYDTYVKLVPTPVREDIVLVEIDDASLSRLGPWPWPRELQARLISAIDRSRPATITYNVLLDGRREGPGDAALASAIAGSSSPVYLTMGAENHAPSPSDGRLSAILPVLALQEAASGLGHASLVIDSDGIVRRAYPDLPASGRFWPSLAMLAAGHAPDPLAAPPGPPQPELIAYTAKGRFKAVSAAQVLENGAAQSAMAGRHVLVGVSASGIESAYPTPLAGKQGYLSGTQIEAHILASLLEGRHLRGAPGAACILLSLLPLWLLLVLLRRTTPGKALCCGGALALAVLLLSYFAFVRLAVWFAPSSALAGLLLAYPLWSWRRLVGLMAFMGHELARFREGAATLAIAAPVHVDPLVNRAHQLGLAIDRARSLHRFIASIAEQLPSPAFVIDESGALTFSNAAGEHLLELLDAGTAIGAQLAPLLEPLRLDNPQAPLVLGGAMPGGAGQAEDELVELAAPDGRHYELQVAALRASRGEPYAWIVQLADISLVKAALHQREEIMQLLTHDMRSPLVSILATLDAHSGDETARIADEVRRLASRALQLADNFVLLAKARSSHYWLEPASLRLLLEDAIDELQPQARALGIALEIGGEEEPWPVEVDHALVQRSLVNLIGNAIKYGAAGRRVLCTISGRETAGRRWVDLSVRDWGQGIAADQTTAIFARFHQVSGSGRRSGAGLGLAFVASVAQGHGGTVTCTSVPGEGATFTLSLPATGIGLPDLDGSDLEDWPASEPRMLAGWR